jgi:CubicO group peptidase (beta-lactamase class C family)
LGGSGAVYLFGNSTKAPAPPPTNSAIYKFWSNWYPTDPINNYCKSCVPGSCWQYSDVGFVSLGFAVAGLNYNSLLNTKITGPLLMNDTAIVPPPGATVAQGYNFDTKTKKPVQAPGASTDLKSPATDMIKWLRAQLYPSEVKDSALGDAIGRTQQIHFRRTEDCPSTQHLAFDMGLAWQFYDGTMLNLPGERVWTKNGASGMGGMSCWVAFLPARKLGIAVLTNMKNIRSYLAQRLADYKIPEKLKIVSEIPRNALGKVDRKLLLSLV